VLRQLQWHQQLRLLRALLLVQLWLLPNSCQPWSLRTWLATPQCPPPQLQLLLMLLQQRLQRV